MRILLFLFLFCASGLFAQEVVTLQVRCTNDISGDPIFGALVSIDGRSEIPQTSKKGDCLFFNIPLDSNLKITVSHGFYDSKTVLFNAFEAEVREGTITVDIRLSKKAQQLNSVDVRPAGVPTTVFGSKTLSVSDFEFMENDQLLLLVYPKRLDKGSQLLISNGLEILNSFEFEEKPTELIHDFRGNSHIVCERGVYGVKHVDNQVSLTSIEKAYYMKYVFPIVDTNQNKLYFSNFSANYPAFDYYAFDRLDSTYTQIIEIKDKLMMELYRSEFKYVDIRTKLWAKNMELETGIDKEIWVGSHYFTQSLYYKELYAPMFEFHDTIFVFDYYKDLLFTFHNSGQAIDSVPIYHHYEAKETGWKKHLIQDRETGKIYAFFEKGGICSLKLVNLKTGELGPPILFSHRYIDKIDIKGNQAYYIYRPFESAQKKFLYKTKLPDF